MSKSSQGIRLFSYLVVAVTTLAAGPAPPAVADPLPSTTVALPGNGAASWTFSGDQVVGIQTDKKGDKLMGRFAAFSVKDGKALWNTEQSLGNERMASPSSYRMGRGNPECYIGTGPLSCMDNATGAVKWTIPCEQIGYVNSDKIRILPGNRLLTFGTKKCDPDDDFDALKEPRVSVVDTQTGKIVWMHDAKSYEYESKLGYWARVAKWQGRRVSADKHRQFMMFLATPKNLFDDQEPEDAQKLVLAGEKLEILNLSDGSFAYQSKDKPGILRGAANGLLFFRKDDDMTAYRGLTGEVAWKFDLKKKGGRVYTTDDLADMGDPVPDGMNDIMISETDVVSRVSTADGKALFTVKRGGMGWQTTKQALLTKKEEKVIAYDWNTGAKLWETKTLEHQHLVDAGDGYLLAVGGEKLLEDGTPVSPYKFACVNAKTGQVLWTKKDLNGKKIFAFEMLPGGLIRLQSGEIVSVLRLADGAVEPADETQAGASGAATEGVETGSDDKVYVSLLEKGMQARTASGKLLWERKGERASVPGNQPKNGLAIWAAADGTVEVINAKDGQTRWSGKVDKDPRVVTNADWTCMVVQNKSKKEATIVQLTP